ncbi:Uncharacterised protein [Mycobacterium tuberculosis]|nr:Uncharacterised protein [Mycobacterium tuberculosis]
MATDPAGTASGASPRPRTWANSNASSSSATTSATTAEVNAQSE